MESRTIDEHCGKPEGSFKEFREKLEEATRKLVYEHHIQIENLTQEQIASALRQAIECGDFQRYVCGCGQPGHSQQVVYIPFKREQELLARISELERELAVSDQIRYEDECRNRPGPG